MKVNTGDRAWHRLADPFRRDVDAGGFSMHCIERGSGPPVLLVHGFGDSTYCWHRNFEALSHAGFRAVAVDQPGLGRSGKPRKDHLFRLEDQAAGVMCAADALGLQRFSIVGHSMGGAIALFLAVNFPQRVEKLVLVAPACYRHPHILAGRLFGLKAWTRFMPREWLVRAGLIAVNSNRGKVSAKMVFEYSNARPWNDYLDALFGLGSNFFSREFTEMTERYSGIRVPLLCVMGRRDLLIPLSFGERLIRDIPDSRIEVFADSAHMPHQEQPEMFNRRLEGFLSGCEKGK